MTSPSHYLVTGSVVHRLTPPVAVTLGRAPGNTIVLEGGHASRNHARLEWDGERPVLQDLGSSNGTLVNGRRIDRTALNDGDQIDAGDQVFVYRHAQDEDQLQESRRLVRDDLDTACMVTPGESLPSTDFAGSLQVLPLLELCQMLNMATRSGRLTLTSTSGLRGRLVTRAGQLVHAIFGTLEGEDAFFAMLSEREGTFEFEQGDFDPPRNLERRTDMLILEGMRRQQEVGGGLDTI